MDEKAREALAACLPDRHAARATVCRSIVSPLTELQRGDVGETETLRRKKGLKSLTSGIDRRQLDLVVLVRSTSINTHRL